MCSIELNDQDGVWQTDMQEKKEKEKEKAESRLAKAGSVALADWLAGGGFSGKRCHWATHCGSRWRPGALRTTVTTNGRPSADAVAGHCQLQVTIFFFLCCCCCCCCCAIAPSYVQHALHHFLKYHHHHKMQVSPLQA